MIEVLERHEPDLKHRRLTSALSSAPHNSWRRPACSLAQLTKVPQHFQVQITGDNQGQDAVHNLSTASIDKCTPAPVPSCGDAKAQELVSVCVFDAEQAAGDEPKDRMKE